MYNLKLNFNQLIELSALVKNELKALKAVVKDIPMFNDDIELLESLNTKIETLFNDNLGHIYKTASIIDNKIKLSDEIESINLKDDYFTSALPFPSKELIKNVK